MSTNPGNAAPPVNRRIASHWHAASEHIGHGGLLLLGFSALLMQFGRSVGGVLMLVALLMQGRHAWHQLKRQPFVWLCLGFAVYVWIRAWLAAVALPQTSMAQYSTAWQWMNLSLVWIVGYWASKDLRRIRRATMLLLVGLGLYILKTTPWMHLSLLPTQWHGFIFGLWHTIAGEYTAILVFGITVYGATWAFKYPETRMMAARTALWLIVLAIAIEALFLTRSRNAWLEATIVELAFVATYLFGIKRLPQFKSCLLAGLVVAVAGAIVAWHIPAIGARLSGSGKLIHDFATGGLSAVPLTSVGLRLHVYVLGIDKWLQAPLFGWGPGSTDWILKHNSLHMDHFHDAYIQLLVELGLAGFLPFAAGGIILLRTLLSRYAKNHFATDARQFLIGAIFIIMFFSLADLNILIADSRALIQLLLGLVLGIKLCRDNARSPTAETHG